MGMNSLFPFPVSCSRRNWPNPDRLGHAKVGESVDDDHTNMGFDDLAFEAPGQQFVPELFEPVHHVFGQAASMIATVVLPAVASLGVDFLEEAIPRVIVAPENGPLSRRNSRLGVPLCNRCVATLGVLGSIGGYLRHAPFDLFEEIGGGASPKTARMPRASILSFSGVPVPCALT